MKRILLPAAVAAAAAVTLVSPAMAQKRGGILNFAVVAEPPTTDCHATTTFAMVHPVALADAGAADLFFFGPEEGGAARIAHVGISIDGERMIHAAGSDCVRVDRVDRLPYRERFLFARRLSLER